jgi:DNA-directed RNA polymerase specialized sigma24 family protein
MPNRTTFAPTRWTLVARTRGDSVESGEALRELCAAYYAPVLVFLERSGLGGDEARDLAHSFFAKILSSGGLDSADQAKGRFRSYLLGAVKHFVADQRDHARREKRGGGVPHEPLDGSEETTAPGLRVADERTLPPDAAFDRQWALTVLDRALTSLAAEHAAASKSEQFDALKPWLTGEPASASQAELAARLGQSEGAVKVAIHRLRHRFRAQVKAEIAATLCDAADLDDELKSLTRAL